MRTVLVLAGGYIVSFVFWGLLVTAAGLVSGEGLFLGFEKWEYLAMVGAMAAFFTEWLALPLGYIKVAGDFLFRVPEDREITRKRQLGFFLAGTLGLVTAVSLVFLTPDNPVTDGASVVLALVAVFPMLYSISLGDEQRVSSDNANELV